MPFSYVKIKIQYRVPNHECVNRGGIRSQSPSENRRRFKLNISPRIYHDLNPQAYSQNI